MGVGAFTGQFDLPLFMVQLFFVFFLCLVYYLRQEDKREGYPLISDRTERTGGKVRVEGFPPMPKPKVFHQPHGRPPVYAPREEDARPLEAERTGLDMPIRLIGPPMLAGVGPGSWVPKIDEPDLNFAGDPVFQPLRALPGFEITPGDPDPRGFAVLGCDKRQAGEVVDVWIDKSEHHAMFLEVALDAALTSSSRTDRRGADERVVAAVVTDTVVDTVEGPVEVVEIETVSAPAPATRDRRDGGTAGGARRILLPMDFASVNGRARTVRTAAITAAQFADVPPHRDETTVTAREENQIRGYYGGGYLWAVPGRAEPLL